MIDDVLNVLDGVKKTANGWEARCPAHDDDRPSLSVAEDDGRVLVTCHAGCRFADIVKAAGLNSGDFFPKNEYRNGRTKKIVAEYSYHDENGALLFQVVRFDPKDFRQRQPDGGGWRWNVEGVPRVLYRLPELVAADPTAWVFVVEGEKDCDRLGSLGLIATTSAGGAAKWKHTDDTPLHGRKVAILPDNDRPGQKHAEHVARCLRGKAAEVRIVALPGLAAKGDVSDWLNAGGTADRLLDLVEATTPNVPCPNTEEPAKANKPEPPSPIEPYKPFPVEALPEPVAAFVRGASTAIGCDPAFVALPSLAALASAIGATRRIRLKRGWCEPCVIWSLIVAESGTLKSPAIDVALEPVRAEQRAAFKRHRDAMERYEEEVGVYEAVMNAWKSKGRKAREPQPEKPQEPVCKRFVVADTTVEALAARLEENPRGVLLARDELAGWLTSFDQYKGGKGGDCAHYLEMQRAGDLLVDRKTGPKKTTYCPHAAVSITGGIQPEILRDALGREHHQDGLAARLLLAMPPTKKKKWTDAEVSFALRDAVARLTGLLINLPSEADDNGYLRPIDIPLSVEGKAAWVEFYDEFAVAQAAAVGDIAAALSKIEGYAARFTLLIHIIAACWTDQNPDAPIDAGSVNAGVTLARWFAHEARRCYALMAEGEEETDNRKLVEWIERQGGDVTPREVVQSCWAVKTTADAKAALEALVQAGLGEWYVAPQDPKGGRPSQRFRLLLPEPIYDTPADDAAGGFADVDARRESENAHHVETSAERERFVI